MVSFCLYSDYRRVHYRLKTLGMKNDVLVHKTSIHSVNVRLTHLPGPAAEGAVRTVGVVSVPIGVIDNVDTILSPLEPVAMVI